MTTLVHRIRAHALDRPGQPALYGPVGHDWKQLSWGVWWASVQQAAGGFLDLGVGTGENVLLWTTARPEWAVVWPALCAIGARPLVLPPDADDGSLLVAASEDPVRFAVTQGRERLERVLQLREQGGLPLDGAVSLDRLDLRVPRLLDLEGLIERGALGSEGVRIRMDRVGPDTVAAILADGRRVTHGQLLRDLPTGVERLALSADLRDVSSLRAMGLAIEAGAELWLHREPERLVRDLGRIEPDAIALPAAGWAILHAAVEELLGDTPGLGGALARRATSGGALEALGRPALARVLRKAGVDGIRAWSTDPVPPSTLRSLAALGIEVRAL